MEIISLCIGSKIKSGGHAFSFNSSSTPGVQISLARFRNIRYDAGQGTVTLGVGLTWDQVYELLEPLSVNVVGGRFVGVGMCNVEATSKQCETV